MLQLSWWERVILTESPQSPTSGTLCLTPAPPPGLTVGVEQVVTMSGD